MSSSSTRSSSADSGNGTRLLAGAIGLPGIMMQGIATISPAFSVLATLVSTVALASIVSPWAYLLGGLILMVQALSTAQLARVLPSAGGWYTWISRTVHPRAGFMAGWILTLWLPPVAVFTGGFLGKVFFEPSIKSYYGIDIPWWIYPIVVTGFVAYASYAGIRISERLLLITGGLELVIMIALALWGFARPGPGGRNIEPLSIGNFHTAPDLFLAIVFAIFAYSGWEAVGPMAEESRNPKRYVPLALVGSVIVLTCYEVIVSYGYLIGIGTKNVGQIASAQEWPVATLAKHLWGPLWPLLMFALLNSCDRGRPWLFQRVHPDMVRDG